MFLARYRMENRPEGWATSYAGHWEAREAFEAGADAILNLAVKLPENFRDESYTEKVVIPPHTRAYVVMLPMEQSVK